LLAERLCRNKQGGNGQYQFYRLLHITFDKKRKVSFKKDCPATGLLPSDDAINQHYFPRLRPRLIEAVRRPALLRRTMINKIRIIITTARPPSAPA
jgi:hypothetical protein